jgi:hypothetical protein
MLTPCPKRAFTKLRNGMWLAHAYSAATCTSRVCCLLVIFLLAFEAPLKRSLERTAKAHFALCQLHLLLPGQVSGQRH